MYLVEKYILYIVDVINYTIEIEQPICISEQTLRNNVTKILKDRKICNYIIRFIDFEYNDIHILLL